MGELNERKKEKTRAYLCPRVGIRLRELRREDWRALRGVGYEAEAAAVRLPRQTCQAVAAQRGDWTRLCIPEAALSRLKISDTGGAASLPIITKCFRAIRPASSLAPASPTAPRSEGRDGAPPTSDSRVRLAKP